MILTCTGCAKSLKIADEHAGKKARCPSCGTVLAIPMSQDVRAAEPAMQPAAAMATAGAETFASKSAQPPTPLPMSAPESSYPATQSTALVPAPTNYPPQPHYANQGHQESQVQPYNPPQYQQQYARNYQQPSHQADPAIAALLEVLGGMFAQTFGIGHIYAGNVTAGLLFMFGYWFLCFVNIVLMFVFIGILTYPLCWIAIMIISPIVAANSVKRY